MKQAEDADGPVQTGEPKLPIVIAVGDIIVVDRAKRLNEFLEALKRDVSWQQICLLSDDEIGLVPYEKTVATEKTNRCPILVVSSASLRGLCSIWGDKSLPNRMI